MPAPRPARSGAARSSTSTSQPIERSVLAANSPPIEPPITSARGIFTRPPLFRPDAGCAHDASPLLDVGADLSREFLRRVAERVGAGRLEALAQLRDGERLAHPGVQPLDDLARRAGRREQAVPGAAFDAGQARLREGRYL